MKTLSRFQKKMGVVEQEGGNRERDCEGKPV